ncbi:TPA: hypothetical protein JDD75_000108 [Salmonella enterica subsp. houtenae]|nr:hypothetical protein [Salmonella enterica subsp. houtenae]
MKADSAAPCPWTTAEWRPGEAWDCQPGLRSTEKEALKRLSDYFAGGGKSNWPLIVRAGLARLILPLRETLDWMNAAKAPANSAVHDILVEMHRLGKSYWDWTQEEWLDVMCTSEGAFRTYRRPSEFTQTYAGDPVDR